MVLPIKRTKLVPTKRYLEQQAAVFWEVVDNKEKHSVLLSNWLTTVLYSSRWMVDLCLRSPFWESISAFPVGIQHIYCISRGKPNSTHEKICQQDISKRTHPENRYCVNHFKTCRETHLIITALCLCNTKVIGVTSFPEDARETETWKGSSTKGLLPPISKALH